MTELAHRPKRSGWSAEEDKMLWETADEAQQQGLPLKAVFERIAQRTGRRPNSIRNYYYAQSREREGQDRKARFVPFQDGEVERLVETVLREKARGSSVRSCLKAMAGGDHSLMLRYQNKYRAVLKTRPELVRSIVEKLNGEGVACETPQVNRRARLSLGEACAHLGEGARRTGDAELVRACETLARHLLREGNELGEREDRERGDKVRYDLCRMALQDSQRAARDLAEAARPVLDCVKEQLALPAAQRAESGGQALDRLAGLVGPLEEAMTRAEV